MKKAWQHFLKQPDLQHCFCHPRIQYQCQHLSAWSFLFQFCTLLLQRIRVVISRRRAIRFTPVVLFITWFSIHGVLEITSPEIAFVLQSISSTHCYFTLVFVIGVHYFYYTTFNFCKCYLSPNRRNSTSCRPFRLPFIRAELLAFVVSLCLLRNCIRNTNDGISTSISLIMNFFVFCVRRFWKNSIIPYVSET